MSRFLTDIMSKKPQEKPKLEVVQKIEEVSDVNVETSNDSDTRTSTPTTTPTSTPTTTPASTGTSQGSIFPTAPASNFQRVTNTITNQAIPQGLFRTGKTKEIYDVLYSLTRGAIVPARTVIVSKPRLRKLTGVGSRVTLDTCLGYLEIVGLIIITKNASGQHDGNLYEVFTPEEIGRMTPTSTPTSTPASTGTSTPGSPAQIVGVVAGVDSRRGSTGSELINTDASDTLKTSFNTNAKNDDDVLRGFKSKFEAASKKLTGKSLSKREAERWEGLADLLILELEVAAARSGGVSSVPAFLTEVLRRQFFTARQKPTEKSTEIIPDIVGKSEKESYEIAPLDEQGRQSALEQLQEFAGTDLLKDFEKWYVPEDWQWLTEKLEVKK